MEAYFLREYPARCNAESVIPPACSLRRELRLPHAWHAERLPSLAGNLGAAFSSGFVVVGSLSKTSVAMSAGGKTQLANLVSALFVLLTLMFLMPLFTNLPVATRGAIVIQAILGLSDLPYMKRILGISTLEFTVAMVALFGVLILSVLHGIRLGVVVALMFLVYRASHPGASVLGQLPGEDQFRDISRNSAAKTYPGLLIFRLDNSLCFANANYFTDQIKLNIEDSVEPIHEVLIDCETMNLIDTTGASALIRLAEELGEKEIRVSLARVRDDVGERIRRCGVQQALGEDRIHGTLTRGVRAFVGGRSSGYLSYRNVAWGIPEFPIKPR